MFDRQDKSLGRVLIPIKDIVRQPASVARMVQEFTLKGDGVEQGAIHLMLTWKQDET